MKIKIKIYNKCKSIQLIGEGVGFVRGCGFCACVREREKREKRGEYLQIQIRTS